MKKIPIAELGIDKQKISPAALRIVKELHKHGHDGFLVGGAVRDLLLGKAPKDFDVVTDARPERIKSIFKRSRIIGRRFRLVHVRIRGELIEVSTYRQKPKQQDRTAQGMIAEDNTFGNIVEDAQRRDLTINALMLDPEKGLIHDYTDGIEDIKRKTLRIIGSPEKRYREDPVRMLRVMRLAAKLECSIAPSTMKPIRELAGLLDDIAPARLLEETVKLIYCHFSFEAFTLLRRHGLLKHLLPHLEGFTAEQAEFYEQALLTTDRLLRADQRTSLSYAISAMYWPLVADSWQEAADKRRGLMMRMRQLYENCGILDNHVLSRIIKAKVWEIWQYQAIFHTAYKKRRALRIRSNYALDKALYFLELRAEFNEVDEQILQWWRDFLSETPEAREAMVPPGQQGKKTGPRRKRTSETADAAGD